MENRSKDARDRLAYLGPGLALLLLDFHEGRANPSRIGRTRPDQIRSQDHRNSGHGRIKPTKHREGRGAGREGGVEEEKMRSDWADVDTSYPYGEW